MTRQERNKRRALIVRRQSVYRAGQTPHVTRRGRGRRAAAADEDDVDEVGGADGLLADLPDGLVG